MTIPVAAVFPTPSCNTKKSDLTPTVYLPSNPAKWVLSPAMFTILPFSKGWGVDVNPINLSIPSEANSTSLMVVVEVLVVIISFPSILSTFAAALLPATSEGSKLNLSFTW